MLYIKQRYIYILYAYTLLVSSIHAAGNRVHVYNGEILRERMRPQHMHQRASRMPTPIELADQRDVHIKKALFKTVKIMVLIWGVGRIIQEEYIEHT